jgi:hypothetical protein
MDPETPPGAKQDPRAQRARMILLIIAAALTISPAIVYVLLARGSAPTP